MYLKSQKLRWVKILFQSWKSDSLLFKVLSDTNFGTLNEETLLLPAKSNILHFSISKDEINESNCSKFLSENQLLVEKQNMNESFIILDNPKDSPIQASPTEVKSLIPQLNNRNNNTNVNQEIPTTIKLNDSFVLLNLEYNVDPYKVFSDIN